MHIGVFVCVCSCVCACRVSPQCDVNESEFAAMLGEEVMAALHQLVEGDDKSAVIKLPVSVTDLVRGISAGGTFKEGGIF